MISQEGNSRIKYKCFGCWGCKNLLLILPVQVHQVESFKTKKNILGWGPLIGKYGKGY